jgi:hypothetical protein
MDDFLVDAELVPQMIGGQFPVPGDDAEST